MVSTAFLCDFRLKINPWRCNTPVKMPFARASGRKSMGIESDHEALDANIYRLTKAVADTVDVMSCGGPSCVRFCKNCCKRTAWRYGVMHESLLCNLQ